MKHYSFLLGLLVVAVFATKAHSQVAINPSNSSPNGDAGLDVDFSDKGFLPPRLALSGTTSSSPLSAHVEGMVVYNTATTGDVTPGLYTNDGSKWIALIPQTYTAGSGISIADNVISASGGSTCPALNLGDNYGGGKVVSTTYPSSTCGYLISRTSDQSTGVVWGCTGTSIPWATQTTYVGAGKDNTKAIAAACATTNIAAKVCDNHTYTEGDNTYDDWFLPSQGELDLIWARSGTIGGFGSSSGEGYWSSSQTSNDNAYHVNSSWGSNKNNVHRVRCVRAF